MQRCSGACMDTNSVHKPKPPVMLVDSSSLLTLLLAGDENQSQYGYARILMALAKRRLIALKTTDMVVAEFLGLQTPIQADMLVANRPQVTAAQVRYGYRFASQRVGMLCDLLRDGSLEIVSTPCGEEYLTRLESLLAMPENAYLATRKEPWPPTRAMVVDRLCKPNTKLARAVHAHNLSETLQTPDGPVRIAVKNGCKDRGEISLGDAVRAVQHDDPDRPIFVLYEGGDVRGRIIQRLQFSAPDMNDPLYHQYGGELEDRFNPNSKAFDLRSVSGLSGVHFVTSYAFLQALMQASYTLEVGDRPARTMDRRMYLVHPHEAESTGNSYDSYRSLMQRVGEKGLPRAYNRFRDCSITALGDETVQAPPRSLKAASGPGGSYVRQLTENEPTRTALCELFDAFSLYRERQIEYGLDMRMHRLLEDIGTLTPARAVPVLERLQHDMQRLHRYMEDKIKIGRGV